MLQGVARIQAASFAFMESLCIYGLVIALAILFAKAVHGSLVLLAHAVQPWRLSIADAVYLLTGSMTLEVSHAVPRHTYPPACIFSVPLVTSG